MPELQDAACFVAISDASLLLTLKSVEDFRRHAVANGFLLVRVETAGKRPVGKNWTAGEPLQVLEHVNASSMNTGLVLDGLRAIDIDVDDADDASYIRAKVREYLGSNPLLRTRCGSSRVALLYRSIGGPAPKRTVSLPNGKVEILGRGQQLVVDGTHPSGARLEWSADRSPATVMRDELPTITEEQITAFINSLHRDATASFGSVEGPKIVSLPAAWNTNDLAAGIIPNRWFNDLVPGDKKAVVAACLNSLENRITDPRERWLRVLFSVADAGRLGCPDARELALNWSRQGSSWTCEADFDRAWHSHRPDRISVGTLLYMAEQSGADLSRWRNLTTPSVTSKVTAQAAEFAPPVRSGRSSPVSNLPAVPKKRQWLHGQDLVRGAISLLVAPGAKGKSSWLITLALACASGRALLNSTVFGGPLRVLYINGEDPRNELALRIRAAMSHHQLSDAQVPGLFVAGADSLSVTLLRPERNGPVLDPAGWAALETEISATKPDVVILDPLVALTGGASLNDNAAAALMMQRMVSVAATNRIAIMIAHHAAKHREAGLADSAMGAASLVNLARISLAIEPLNENDAGKLGVAPWDSKSIFRVIGAKQNLSPPSTTNNWYRLISVEIPNAEPPIYPNGDQVAVVESFTPAANATPFSSTLLDDVCAAVAQASPPLSPAAKSPEFFVPRIVPVLARHRNGAATDVEAKSVITHLLRIGRILITDVRMSRTGRGAYVRKGLEVVKVNATQHSQTP